MTLAKMDTYLLFQQFLNTCKAALSTRAEEFGAVPPRTAPRERLILVTVTERGRREPAARFTIGVRAPRLRLLGRGQHGARREWRVQRKRLRQVVEQQDLYIEQPARLDLEWLKQGDGG